MDFIFQWATQFAMGKTKKKEATNNKVQASKCSCEDPYKCSCGNRPERPSKGHKWYPEDQIWAGKGHKQKGASGQVATFSQQATVTAKGKTQVQQWQRLPSQLLAELCQKQKRKPPKYHSIQEGSSFKYRVIVCDTKDSEKDLIFIPAQAVANEEQAKEEAAMLGLLELTPTIPHERKLPEPYRTTWLNAIAAQKSKEASDHGKGLELKQSKKDSTVASTSQPTTQTNAAQASSTLTLGTKYTSNASKRHQFEEKRRMRNEKIRRHDAIRMANQNHPVFMSASIRKQIESLLRSETNSTDNRNENEEDDNDDMEDAAHDAQAYVEERLHHEGFSKRQARMASSATLKSNPNLDIDEERVWDTLYEQCLQWLLVHVDEEQLPEGFDPRGRTLDVVVAPTQSSTNKPSGSAEASNEGETIALAENYGISVKEAGLMVAKAREERKENEQVFWETIIAVSGLSIFGERSEVASDEMYESTKEELEKLEAIFASDFQSEAKDHDFTSIKIALAQDSMVLALDVKNGVYPAIPPARILVKGKWPEKCGVALHVDLLKFVADLPLGEPMIFSIHAHVQDLIQSCNFDNPFSLLPLLGVQPENSKTVEAVASLNATYEEIEISVSNLVQTPQRRPRELRKTFWTIHPRDTPAALAFPAVGSPIKRMRESLPAAKARQEFLAALKRAEKNGRVVLVTGETGSGK
jgi:ATP-dependent RNA helicase DHX57